MVEIALREAINNAMSLIYSAFKLTPSLKEFFPGTSASAYDALRQAKDSVRNTDLDAGRLFRSSYTRKSYFTHHASSC